jgi:hypothetical protein
VALYAIHALHHRARCDRCGVTSAVHCSESVAQARADAADHLRMLGWKHEVSTGEAARDWVEIHGAGNWLCPACGGPSRA